MTAHDPQPRLYLDTPRSFDPADLAARLQAVMDPAIIACVRLSLADDAQEDAWTLAVNHLLPVCHAADVPLLVTDHFRLVAPLGLDGVHLSSGKASVRDVRDSLGSDRIVGALAGTSRHDGMVLAEAGCDYVGFGPVGSTGALGSAALADDDLFAWWAEMIETPIVAEGAV
ncbi:MAG: thiamine phosphate synthase, partial [Pseudomonadota bacterium]